ncbi:MAG TPA: TerC/Alx family metal homeostasis membrane protein [Mycobacterium sp.]
MDLTPLEWVVTLAVLIAVLLFDVAIIARRPHEPSVAECAVALSAYLGLAVLFGVWLCIRHGAAFGMQFFAGWLTEYSLSVDNLFVFALIMTSFKVPRVYQQGALLVGIILALVLRGGFIAIGAVAIQRLSWSFYLFGAFLIYVAVRLARSSGHEGGDNAVVRLARTYLNTTDQWDGLRLYVKEESGGSPDHDPGKRAITPMFMVIVALATTDLVFALDSIPAIYGLTREPYLVFTATVFALMGLRQLYFILGKLLDRLAYLSRGLAVILAFIGLKMVLHALHDNEVAFINGGAGVDVPEISTAVSLGFVVLVLVVATAASLYQTRGSGQVAD